MADGQTNEPLPVRVPSPGGAMKVWWCSIHEGEKRPDWHGACWKSSADVWLDGDCQMAEMELHPAGTRVVTAEALVIEPGEDDLWPEWAIDLIWEAIGPSFNRGQINHILDALAQSKDAP